MTWWIVSAAANFVIAVAYLAIFSIVATGLARTGGWRSNRLALATGFIFFSCGIGHGLHFVHLLLPSIGVHDEAATASRAAVNEWHVAPWEVVTAGAGVWYFTLRGRLPAVVRTASLFEDGLAQRRRALEIHDGVVQGLVAAKLAFDTGHSAEGRHQLDAAIDASRRIVSEYLATGEEGGVKAGDLRRLAAIAPRAT